MSFRLGKFLYTLCLIALLVPVAGAVALSSWRGVLRDSGGKPISAATVKLTSSTGGRHYQASTTGSGEFALSDILAGDYDVSVESGGKSWRMSTPLAIAG
ncbi:MAG TPA: carboxypeptidase-like regulatory domain-containing protein, partial [Terriglobales bacterium]|nr:carboxypeptidase-like regulatory domain-containing protein [Terriglobales bacterium]